MKTLFTFVLVSILLSSCDTIERVISPERVAEEKITLAERLDGATPVRWEIKKDFVYDTESVFQKYDLHRPIFDSTNTTPSLVVITIHGGGWSLLDKGYLDPIIGEFRKLNKNLTIFNMNHRLAFEEGVSVDEMLEDIDLMIAEIDRRKEELNLSDEIVIHGHSSGGHLALLYAKDRLKKKRITAISAIAPPTDLTDPKVKNLADGQNRNLTEMLIDASYEDEPQLYKKASPYHNTTRSSRPTILFFGENDEIIGIEQGEKMVKKLAEKNVPYKYYRYSNIGHNMQNRWREIPGKVISFLQER